MKTAKEDHTFPPSKGPKKHPENRVTKKNDTDTQKDLDEGLDETFPASDPVAVSPGAD